MKVTMHRALSQLKTTERRLNTDLRSYKFVATTIGRTGTSDGRSVDDVEKTLKSNYDSITKLIKNYETIKLAIIRSNSGITEDTLNISTTEICGKTMILAEIIAKLKFVIPLMENFVTTLTSQYNKALSDIEMTNRRVSSDVTRVITSISGGDSTKLSDSQVATITKSYYDNNNMMLVDPLNISKKIEQWKAEIDDFKVAADARLSEENALKIIDIDF